MEFTAAVIVNSNKFVLAVGSMAQLDDTVPQEETKLKGLVYIAIFQCGNQVVYNLEIHARFRHTGRAVGILSSEAGQTVDLQIKLYHRSRCRGSQHRRIHRGIRVACFDAIHRSSLFIFREAAACWGIQLQGLKLRGIQHHFAGPCETSHLEGHCKVIGISQICDIQLTQRDPDLPDTSGGLAVSAADGHSLVVDHQVGNIGSVGIGKRQVQIGKIPCQAGLQGICQPNGPGVDDLSCLAVQGHICGGKSGMQAAALQLLQLRFRCFQLIRIGYHRLDRGAQRIISLAGRLDGSLAGQSHRLTNGIDQIHDSLGFRRGFLIFCLVSFQVCVLMGSGEIVHDDFHTFCFIGTVFAKCNHLNDRTGRGPVRAGLVNIGLLGYQVAVDKIGNIRNRLAANRTVAVFHSQMIGFGSRVIFTVCTDLDAVNRLIGIVRIHQIQICADSVKHGYQSVSSGRCSRIIPNHDVQGARDISGSPVCISLRGICKGRQVFDFYVHFHNGGRIIRNSEIQRSRIAQLLGIIHVILDIGCFIHTLRAKRIQLISPAVRIQRLCAISNIFMRRNLCVNICIKNQLGGPSRFHAADLNRECIGFGRVGNVQLGQRDLHLFGIRGKGYSYPVDLQQGNVVIRCHIQIFCAPGNAKDFAIRQRNRPTVGRFLLQIHAAIYGDGFF